MNPPKRITDSTFRYVPSHDTDIRATFARIRAEQQELAARQKAGIVPLRKVQQ